MKNATKVITAIAALCVAGQVHAALIHTHEVPWFSGPDVGVGDAEIPDPGYPDFGGATWRHHRNTPYQNYYTGPIRTQQWSSARLRWESTSGPGSSEAFYDGPLQNGTQPTLWTGGDQTDAIMMFTPAPPAGGGLYSFYGTLELDATGTTDGIRAEVMHYDAAGDYATLYSFTSSSDTNDVSLDLGAQAGLQNITVLPGERLGFGFRKVGLDGEVEGFLYGADPLAITGEVIPEPASLALLGLGMALAVRSLRRRSA